MTKLYKTIPNDDNEILQLDKKAQETLVAILTSKTMTEAAEKLSIDRTTLYKRIARYNLDEFIDEIPKQALMTLKMGSVRAASELISEVEHRRVDVRQKAATEILDRVGVGAKVRNQTNVQVNVQPILGIARRNENNNSNQKNS